MISPPSRGCDAVLLGGAAQVPRPSSSAVEAAASACRDATSSCRVALYRFHGSGLEDATTCSPELAANMAFWARKPRSRPARTWSGARLPSASTPTLASDSAMYRMPPTPRDPAVAIRRKPGTGDGGILAPASAERSASSRVGFRRPAAILAFRARPLATPLHHGKPPPRQREWLQLECQHKRCPPQARECRDK